MIRIAIADDHEIFRKELKTLLSRQTEIEFVGEACNGRELLEIVEKNKPDVILTDIVMPEMNGIEAVKRISKKFPVTKIIALSMFNNDSFICESLEAGALGYLMKDAELDEILDAIQSVTNDLPYYSPSLMPKVVKLLSEPRNVLLVKGIKLSEIEFKIIKYICDELTNKEIAEKLSWSKRTVEGYRERIIQKLGVKNTAGIVKFAVIYKIT